MVNNGCADDTGRGSEHGGNHDHCQTETALQRTKQVADREEQSIRNLGMCQKFAISTNIGMATME